jgi:hypothetical protein
MNVSVEISRMETTTEREATMAWLAAIAGEMERLEAAEPTAREIEIRVQHPRWDRERILRMVARELVDGRQTCGRD